MASVLFCAGPWFVLAIAAFVYGLKVTNDKRRFVIRTIVTLTVVLIVMGPFILCSAFSY